MIKRVYHDRSYSCDRLSNKYSFNFLCPWLYERELGNTPPCGFRDRLHKDLYSSVQPVTSWDPGKSIHHTHHGGVFNLEFAPDGHLLVAACERRSILVFDPLTGNLVNCVDRAHDDCVNCVRFLDSRVFATCSDDMTVALWDVRYLKHRIRSLRGHSNWVKNIEYASSAGLLVTSGFDGSIYTWDINRYTEGEVQFKRVFHTDGLMRTKLTPDNSKLLLCTTGGYLMVISNLDLLSLAADLQTFKPNMYRLMQLSETPIPLGYSFNHLFTARRNRVELVSDFPQGNDAEVISSLQVHPQGWCMLSRNTSSDENSEWTCVHDIQDIGRSKDFDDEESSSDPYDRDNSLPPKRDISPDLSSGDHSSSSSASQNTGNRPLFTRPVVHIRFNCLTPRPGNRTGSEGEASSSNRFSNIELHISTPDVLEALSSSRQAVELNSNQISVVTGDENNWETSNRQSTSLSADNRQQSSGYSSNQDTSASSGLADAPSNSSSSSDDSNLERDLHLDYDERPAFFIRTGSQLAARTLLLLGPNQRTSGSNRGRGDSDPDPDGTVKLPKIHRNLPRLTHFIDELNVGRGFIKELCFSTDGRLVCSPFGYGIRLLSFDADCHELCDSVPLQPQKLHEIATNISHTNVVVSTKFSPTHFLLVSGCLNGKVCFHQPCFRNG